MQRTIHLVALLIGILAPFARPASLPINTDVVEKSVVFLYYPRDNQGNSEAGTGFFVEIPLKSDPEHVHWAIVTARHLVDPDCSPSWRSTMTASNFRWFNRRIDASTSWQTSGEMDNSSRAWLNC